MGMSKRIFKLEIETGYDANGDTYPVVNIYGGFAYLSIEVQRNRFGELCLYDHWGYKFRGNPRYKYFGADNTSTREALQWLYEQECVSTFTIRGKKCELSVSVNETDNDTRISVLRPDGCEFGDLSDAIVWLVEQESA